MKHDDACQALWDGNGNMLRKQCVKGCKADKPQDMQEKPAQEYGVSPEGEKREGDER